MCLFDYSMFRDVHLRFIFVNLRNITSKIQPPLKSVNFLVFFPVGMGLCEKTNIFVENYNWTL